MTVSGVIEKKNLGAHPIEYIRDALSKTAIAQTIHVVRNNRSGREDTSAPNPTQLNA